MSNELGVEEIDQSGDDEVASLEEGRLLDYITGQPVKDTPKEQVRRKYSEVLWKGMPVAGVAVARGYDGDSVTGEGFRRSAVAGPRCGGPRGWRSRAGTG